MLVSFILPSLLLLPTARSYQGGKLLTSLEPLGSPKGLSDEDLGLFVPVGKALPGGSVLAKRDVQHPKQLSPRQSVCQNPSYGLCPSGQFCCPLGGECCNDGDCCASGNHCCSAGGCCQDTHTCVTVGGVRGCCPIGKTCTGGATTCADPGYVPCEDFAFCCRPGDTCSLDSSGSAICTPGGGLTTARSTSSRSSAVGTASSATSIAPPPSISDPLTFPPPTTSATSARSTTSQSSLGPGVPSTQVGPLFSFSSSRSSSLPTSSPAPGGIPASNALGVTVSLAVGAVAVAIHGLGLLMLQ